MKPSSEQIVVLRKPLAPGRVRTNPQGNSYLAGWDVRAHLTRIFGYGGWDFEVRDIDLCYAVASDEGKHTVGYRATGRLTVRDPYEAAVVYEDAAVGGATNQPTAEAAYDLAVKAAVSGALKRCAVNLGTQFGLSLYNAGQLADVVKVVIPYDGLPDIEDDAVAGTPVETDDLDDHLAGGDYA